jgi:hypothetical protein
MISRHTLVYISLKRFKKNKYFGISVLEFLNLTLSKASAIINVAEKIREQLTKLYESVNK